MNTSSTQPPITTPPNRRSSWSRTTQYVKINTTRRLKLLFSVFLPLRRRTIVFESYNGRSYACSPKAIYQHMLTDPKFRNYTFIWAFKDIERYRFLMQDPRTRLVEHKSHEYYQAFSRSKYWVVNSMVPLAIGKRRDQVMLQTWHGTPLKRLRGDIVEDTQATLNSQDDMVMKNRLDSNRYDYFVIPSPRTKKNFISAFSLPVKQKPRMLLQTGYPRNDYLHNYEQSDVAAIKRELEIPEDKKVILYAPTWRDDQYNPELGYVYEPPIDFSRLREELGDEYVVLFRAHYFVADTYDFSRHAGFVYNASSVDDVNDLYVVSDVLITDYSSVLFDFANMERPMLFYMYDRKHYQKELRGFYFPPEELPGDIVETQDEIVTRLKDLEKYTRTTRAKLTAFREEFNPLDDGHATERVVKAVWSPRRKRRT